MKKIYYEINSVIDMINNGKFIMTIRPENSSIRKVIDDLKRYPYYNIERVELSLAYPDTANIVLSSIDFIDEDIDEKDIAAYINKENFTEFMKQLSYDFEEVSFSLNTCLRNLSYPKSMEGLREIKGKEK